MRRPLLLLTFVIWLRCNQRWRSEETFVCCTAMVLLCRSRVACVWLHRSCTACCLASRLCVKRS